jgi:hypothetical protein
LRAWYEKIDQYLQTQGLTKNNVDHNLYYLQEDGKMLIIVLYVDDHLATRDHIEIIHWLKN